MVMKGYQKDDVLRNSFNELAKEIFCLDFTNYYNSGYWKDNYIPYSIMKDGMVVSNISVNLMPVRVLSEERLYIQIGTVMTKKAYRNQGLARRIMEEIKKDWLSSCDAMFLFGNDSVLSFYPKFGFEKSEEFRYEKEIIPDVTCGDGKIEVKDSKAEEAGSKAIDAVKLDMNKKEDQMLLTSLIAKGNPYSSLTVYQNYDLVMFYCIGMMKNHIYYFKDWNLAVIAHTEGKTLVLHDIFGERKVPLEEVLRRMAGINHNKCQFSFTPKEVDDTYHPVSYHEEDCTLFFHEKQRKSICHS